MVIGAIIGIITDLTIFSIFVFLIIRAGSVKLKSELEEESKLIKYFLYLYFLIEISSLLLLILKELLIKELLLLYSVIKLLNSL